MNESVSEQYNFFLNRYGYLYRKTCRKQPASVDRPKVKFGLALSALIADRFKDPAERSAIPGR